ncbi:MAG TPA: hypothetical protein VHE14_07335 [Solirubrobacteraceae bacterium]|nr:hypothetical protein [Solirubrobacteraceae bacterium]
MAAPSALAAAGSTPPAGGAATSDIIIATAGAVVVSILLITPVVLYKNGRFAVLGRLSAFAGKVSGVPGWAALPGAVLVGTLSIAVFGMYWDISLHLDNGRDPGPLANGAHYFILAGLFGVLLAGIIAMALPPGRTRTAIRIPILGWDAPVGALLIVLCGSFSLIAFPLDDIWHRLFGQDVTLWGPTHLMLIGGAALSILGAWALHVEGVASSKPDGAQPTAYVRWREIALAGAFLIGMSTFQAEYDFGIPQFRLVFQPILLMLAAGVVLVAARIRIGRGGALLALITYLGVRGLLALLVGPILGQTTPHFPLYIAEALCVEGVALLAFRGRSLAATPLRFGALAGVAIGTIGLAAEWGFSHVWVVIPWPSSLFPEAAILGLITAIAAGVIGGFIGRCLTPGEARSERMPGWIVPLAAAAVVGVIAFSVPMSAGHGHTAATFTLRELTPPPNRSVAATIRLSPPNAAKNAEWLHVLNYQGRAGRPSSIDPLKRIGPGVYETTKPIRVTGRWKATLRLAKGRNVLGLAIFLPQDRAIPATEVPATNGMTRPFILDKKLLQREAKKGVSSALTLIAYLVVLAIFLGVIGTITWGLRRLERYASADGPQPPAKPAAAERPRPSVAGRSAAPPIAPA